MNIQKILREKFSFFKESNSFYGTGFCIFSVIFFVPFAYLFKFPDPYTTIKWIITLFSLNFCLSLFLINSKNIIIPKLPYVFLYIFGLTLGIILINSYFHNVSLISYDNVKRFFFWGTVLFFFNLFSSQKEITFYKIEKIICFTVAIFVSLALIQYILHPTEQPYFTFGNINLSAEFVGFSLVFQLGSLVRLWKNFKKSIFLNIFTALSLSYIYFIHCRSIYIATSLILISILLFNKNLWKELLKLITLSAFFAFAIKIIIFLFHPYAVMPGLKEFAGRWLLYLNTLKMIMENPLGVGVGQYEFAAIPYVGNLVSETKETVLYLTPHDEFLHLLAEDGIHLSLLFFALGCVFISFFRKDIKKIFSQNPEFIYFIIVLFVQSLFQFPLIEPIPYFMTAMMIGYFFSTAKIDHVTYSLKRGSKAILLSTNLLAFLVFSVYFSSRYIGFNLPYHEQLNRLACSYGYREWLPCLNVAYSHMLQGDYDTTDVYALRVLDWQPLNYQAIKMLGFSSMYQGNYRKACKLFRQYDALFENDSSLHEIINKECQAYP